MKMMTCRQLGGACELEFYTDTFEEIAELSKQHGMEMHQQQDFAHLEAMKKIQELMRTPEVMNEWQEKKERNLDRYQITQLIEIIAEMNATYERTSPASKVMGFYLFLLN